MSGSGPGGGDWNPPSGRCDTLSQQTVLNSPDPAVLARIQKGDLLEIRVSTVGKALIVQAIHRGQVAGSVTSSIIQKLAECVEQGYEYVAEVLEDVRGGVCKVRVRAK